VGCTGEWKWALTYMRTVVEREWQNRNGGRTREWPTTLVALIVVEILSDSISHLMYFLLLLNPSFVDFEIILVLDGWGKFLVILSVWDCPRITSSLWFEQNHECVKFLNSFVRNSKAATKPHSKLSFWIYFGCAYLFMLKLHESPSLRMRLVRANLRSTWPFSIERHYRSDARHCSSLALSDFGSALLLVLEGLLLE
jgi:hypothetical protein